MINFNQFYMILQTIQWYRLVLITKQILTTTEYLLGTTVNERMNKNIE